MEVKYHIATNDFYIRSSLFNMFTKSTLVYCTMSKEYTASTWGTPVMIAATEVVDRVKIPTIFFGRTTVAGQKN